MKDSAVPNLQNLKMSDSVFTLPLCCFYEHFGNLLQVWKKKKQNKIRWNTDIVEENMDGRGSVSSPSSALHIRTLDCCRNGEKKNKKTSVTLKLENFTHVWESWSISGLRLSKPWTWSLRAAGGLAHLSPPWMVDPVSQSLLGEHRHSVCTYFIFIYIYTHTHRSMSGPHMVLLVVGALAGTSEEEADWKHKMCYKVASLI